MQSLKLNRSKLKQRQEGANPSSSQSATLPRLSKSTGMGSSASAQHSQEANSSNSSQATQQPVQWGHARMGIFAKLDPDSLPNRDPKRVELFRQVQLGEVSLRDLRDADPNQPGPYNRRLLHAAAESDRAELVVQLLGHLGASVDAVDADGWSAAHFAASADAGWALDELMKRCSRLGKLCNQDGQTPLMTAAIFGAPKAAAVLLRTGGDVEASDLDGDTPAMLAVKCRQASVLRLLLGHKRTAKAQLKVRNRQGKSVTDLVTESGDAEMAQIVKAVRK